MRRRHLPYLLLGLAALAGALLLQPVPGDRLALFGLPLPSFCLTRNLLGFSCPTCGMTRAFAHAARLDLGAAWSVSPLGLILFALLFAQIPYRAARLLLSGTSPTAAVAGRGPEV
jgi:hypothetical protein